ARLQVRNARGEMVPLGSVVEMVPSFGPDPVIRYNGYPAADVSASPFDPMAVSTTDAVRIARETAAQVLPRGMALEFTGLTYQQVNQGVAQYLVFPLCVLLVYLVLAALYESWSLPLAVILIVPMCMLSAFGGIYVLNFINDKWFIAQIILGWINPMTAAPPAMTLKVVRSMPTVCTIASRPTSSGIAKPQKRPSAFSASSGGLSAA
ncbi:MAG: efflux RND transporter permease subunit, partial [Rhodobacteraceae bacterium]|nr:efflux RND transporter permease subunit [Paracoccaceae bacterium]